MEFIRFLTEPTYQGSRYSKSGGHFKVENNYVHYMNIDIFFLIYRWLRMIACFARSNNRIITSSKQYVLILNKEFYIISVKFCPDNSQFVKVFQIHLNVMLLFRIVVISYVFHLFFYLFQLTGSITSEMFTQITCTCIWIIISVILIGTIFLTN